MSLSQAQIADIEAIVAAGVRTSKASEAEEAAARDFLIQNAPAHLAADEPGNSHKPSNVLSATVARAAAGTVVVRVNAFRPSTGLGIMFGRTLSA